MKGPLETVFESLPPGLAEAWAQDALAMYALQDAGLVDVRVASFWEANRRLLAGNDPLAQPWLDFHVALGPHPKTGPAALNPNSTHPSYTLSATPSTSGRPSPLSPSTEADAERDEGPERQSERMTPPPVAEHHPFRAPEDPAHG